MDTDQLLKFLNNSTREELTALPGIGLSLSDRILEARPFESLEDAKAVKGIGAKILESWVEIPASQPDSVPDAIPISDNETPQNLVLRIFKDSWLKKDRLPAKTCCEFGESAKKKRTGCSFGG